MIIEMSKILKRNTSDEEKFRYNVGGFKVVPNIIGIVNIINITVKTIGIRYSTKKLEFI